MLEHTGTQFWQIHWPYYVVAVLHVLQDGQVFGVVCKQVILLFATLLKALFMVQWLCGLGLEKIIATVLLLLAVYTWCGTTTTSLLYYVSCKTIKFPAAAANNLRGSKTGPLLSSSSIVDRCVWDSVAAIFCSLILCWKTVWKKVWGEIFWKFCKLYPL